MKAGGRSKFPRRSGSQPPAATTTCSASTQRPSLAETRWTLPIRCTLVSGQPCSITAPWSIAWSSIAITADSASITPAAGCQSATVSSRSCLLQHHDLMTSLRTTPPVHRWLATGHRANDPCCQRARRQHGSGSRLHPGRHLVAHQKHLQRPSVGQPAYLRSRSVGEKESVHRVFVTAV